MATQVLHMACMTACTRSTGHLHTSCIRRHVRTRSMRWARRAHTRTAACSTASARGRVRKGCRRRARSTYTGRPSHHSTCLAKSVADPWLLPSPRHKIGGESGNGTLTGHRWSGRACLLACPSTRRLCRSSRHLPRTLGIETDPQTVSASTCERASSAGCIASARGRASPEALRAAQSRGFEPYAVYGLGSRERT